MTCWTLQLIVLLVNCLGEIFNAATPWTLDTADISPGGISQPPSLASWLRGGAHVPRPSSRLHSCLVEIFTASRTAVQFSRIGVKTVTLASWRFFSTLWIFKFSPLCAFKCILPWSGSWLGRALRELESRCCQLRPREIDSRAQIRTRSVAQSQWEMCKLSVAAAADEIGSRSQIRRAGYCSQSQPQSSAP